MKNISTLVQDIYDVLEHGKVELDEVKLAEMIKRRLEHKQSGATLRMSNFGTPCQKKLWYQVNRPDMAETLPAYVRLNFLMGDIAEEVVLALATQAGHTVTGEQDELSIAGVKGHRDAIIDGVLVDVKTANGRGFEKFKYHKVETDDPFGYHSQLGLYLAGSQEDVSVKNQAAFLAFNKERGHLALDTYTYPQKDWTADIEAKKKMVELPWPPDRGFQAEPHNKSGNMKLCTACSYCPFKKDCWPEMRTFIYSNGPVHLVRVVKEPDVPEVKDAKGTKS